MGANKTKHAGLGDELYEYPRQQVEKISDIKVADHIIFQRKLYEHHGIVVAVDKNEGTFDVIEYDKTESNASAKVAQTTHIFFDKPECSLYIVQYRGECLPDAEVIENAKRWLNATGYNVLLNNCECMAQACKTGKHKTEQVRNLFKFLGKDVGPKALRSAIVGATKVAETLGEKGVITGFSKLGTGITKLGTPFVAFGGAVEAGIAAYDIHNIVKQHDKGMFNDRRRDAMIGTRVATGVGDTGGGVGGMIAGGLVAGPVGAVLGGLIGGLGGRHVAWGTAKGVITAIEKNSDHFEDKKEEGKESSRAEGVDKDYSMRMKKEGWRGLKDIDVEEMPVYFNQKHEAVYLPFKDQ